MTVEIQDIQFSFDGSPDVRASIAAALGRVVPLLTRDPLLVGVRSRLLVVAYTDAHVMEEMLPRIGSQVQAQAQAQGEEKEEEDEDPDACWKPFLVCATTELAAFPIVEDNDGDGSYILIGVGYYDDEGELCAGYLPLRNDEYLMSIQHHMLVLMHTLRYLVAFEVPVKKLFDRSSQQEKCEAVLTHMASACAACGVCQSGSTLTRCRGCGLVAFCGVPECERASRCRHAKLCMNAAVIHRMLDPNSAHIPLGDSQLIMGPTAALPPSLTPARLAMDPNGWFDDARRSTLVWDVTQPPSEARLIPACLSAFKAWRRGFLGERITTAHLDAALPPGIDALHVTYFDVRVRVTGTTLRALMGAVYAAMVSPAPRHRSIPAASDDKKQQQQQQQPALALKDADHRRFDHLMKRGYGAHEERWIMQLGGARIHHRGLPRTGYHLYEVTFA